jgi:hypothetical protein
LRQQSGIALHREHRRRIRQQSKQGRVVGITPKDETRAKLRHGIGFPRGFLATWDARRGFAFGEKTGQSLQRRRPAAMPGEQAAKAHGANALGLGDAP